MSHLAYADPVGNEAVANVMREQAERRYPLPWAPVTSLTGPARAENFVFLIENGEHPELAARRLGIGNVGKYIQRLSRWGYAHMSETASRMLYPERWEELDNPWSEGETRRTLGWS